MIVLSLLVGFAVGFSTDITRQDPSVARRRLLWVAAALAWCAIVLVVDDGMAQLGNTLLTYAGGTLVGLLGREYQRAGSS